MRAFGRKAFIVTGRAQLQEALALQPQPPPLLVQSYVSGVRHNLYFFAEAGVVRAIAQVKIIRTDRRDGTGYAVEEAFTPVPTDLQWRDHLTRLASHLRYDGPGCLQFIHDGVFTLHHPGNEPAIGRELRDRREGGSSIYPVGGWSVSNAVVHRSLQRWSANQDYATDGSRR